MMKNVPARYIFEQSPDLIELPTMPVDFARDRLEPFGELLERIDREGYIPAGEWEKGVPHDQRRELEALIEIESGQLTFSPVGFLDEYDRLMQENWQSNLGAKVVKERRSRYEPFFRMDLYRSE